MATFRSHQRKLPGFRRRLLEGEADAGLEAGFGEISQIYCDREVSCDRSIHVKPEPPEITRDKIGSIQLKQQTNESQAYATTDFDSGSG
ncbi:MAG: hypothetical protein KME17_12940 [Cyanosarcina radialis HA8281-LM2]|nr:hypothetical protein [Cyanosarcina radialis HA8281-LM2]